MGSLRYTDVIDRASLTKDCLEEVRLWPGCETVHSVAILQDGTDNFLVRVVAYGAAKKKTADRAALCIQREKRRRYHLIWD
jgi:hypothetical protein